MENCPTWSLKSDWQEAFPCLSTRYASLADDAEDVNGRDRPGSSQQRTKAALHTLNKEWEKETGLTFEQAVVKTPDTNLQLKPSANEIKN